MKQDKKTGRKKKFHAALIITSIIFPAVLILNAVNAFTFLEYKTYDLRANMLAKESRPSDDIIVILLSQDSIDWAAENRGWGWPWPRKAYAEIIDYMNIGGAYSVAFDVIFSEPSIYRNAQQDVIIDEAVAEIEKLDFSGQQEVQEAAFDADRQRGERRQSIRNIIGALRTLSSREDDVSLAHAGLDYGRTVQVVMLSSQTGNAITWPPDMEKPVFKLHNFAGNIEDEYKKLNQNIKSGETMKAQFPIPMLRDAAGIIGNISGWPDSDSVFRRANLFTIFDGKAIPGLSAASLLVSGHDNNITYNEKKGVIEWEDRIIPVDKNGRSILKFRGTLDRYNPYFAHEILMSKEALENGTAEEMGMNFLPPENFENAYIFFGFYAPGLFDIANTPISSVYPGVGMHITMLDNILSGDFIWPSTQVQDIILIFFAVVLVTALTLFLNRIPLVVTGLIIILSFFIGLGFWAYNYTNLWLPMAAPLAGAIITFLTITLYNYATEGSQKRFIKSAFSQYLSPKVIEQIIADPSQLKLGGDKREMTAIFTDVRSFSTISEALGDPQKLVELLNHYLTRMSNIILENQGTIDKYEGDAIIAFFGAPVHLTNHASFACRSAIKMKKAEASINREALACGLINQSVIDAMLRKGIMKNPNDPCPMFTRIGINTGDMVVGNMGTPNKMAYTIMGNAVNLASRLEGVNKQYNTGGILISEYTRNQIGDDFVLRPLSRVRVVGINTPLRLFELLEIKEEATPEIIEMAKKWEQGFAAYEKKNFPAAANIFQEIYELDKNDLVIEKYYDRCNRYISFPPADAQWDDGVDNLTEK